jgi:type I restriction enzyme R subunit
MTETRTKELAFETVIEAHLLQHGYECVPADAFDRERAIFPQTALAFIRETQPTEWAKLEALHGDKTAEQILTDLCK